ncbi:unnamed protein product [Dicrocoelium dendriticum]|nr:unnamed protein product [Dicrocoelium dendriticum]
MRSHSLGSPPHPNPPQTPQNAIKAQTTCAPSPLEDPPTPKPPRKPPTTRQTPTHAALKSRGPQKRHPHVLTRNVRLSPTVKVYPDGRVCISILHAPGDDPLGYECSVERWSPVQSVEKILLSVVSMLAEPNDESAANVDAAKTWREDKRRFNKLALRSVRLSLGLPAE